MPCVSDARIVAFSSSRFLITAAEPFTLHRRPTELAHNYSNQP